MIKSCISLNINGILEFLSAINVHDIPSVAIHMEVSWNRGTPKSSLFIGFCHYKPSILGFSHWWNPPFSIDFPLIFHDFPLIFPDFPWFSIDFPWFSRVFHDFPGWNVSFHNRSCPAHGTRPGKSFGCAPKPPGAGSGAPCGRRGCRWSWCRRRRPSAAGDHPHRTYITHIPSGFHSWGSQNGWFVMENLIKLDDIPGFV